MTKTAESKDQFFTAFNFSTDSYAVPESFTFLQKQKPHPLCLLAAEQLQTYLSKQEEWVHNFGLSPAREGIIIGKMFGILVVKNRQNEIGYLAAFSGKLAGGNHHTGFVPPVFDALAEKSFLNRGMAELSRINLEIQNTEALQVEGYKVQIDRLKSVRRKHSVSLQYELFNQYIFLNQSGEEKGLIELFKNASYKNPPAGAGECAAPKLLQYAFQQKMKPLAIAEFWWGQSPKSDFWKHGHFYPCCKEKCEPILAHMLNGLDCEIPS